MTGAIECRYYGRDFTAEEMALLRALIAGPPALNPRFLILPWVEIQNLGSHILAIVRRRLPQDWTERYNITPVLIETFVETPRYTGAVYRASGSGSMSGPPKDAGATTGKSSTTNPARTSGSGPSDAIGRELSIANIVVLSTARPKAFPNRDAHGCAGIALNSLAFCLRIFSERNPGKT